VQALQQSLGVPGSYVACFSAWLRSTNAGTIVLQRDATAATVKIGPVWQRFFVKATGANGAVQSVFALVLGSGQMVDVWGLQVEAQPWPAAYKQTSVPEGIYEETYFATDELKITSTSPGLSSCEIRLMSRV
jgi:hypothetical protein